MAPPPPPNARRQQCSPLPQASVQMPQSSQADTRTSHSFLQSAKIALLTPIQSRRRPHRRCSHCSSCSAKGTSQGRGALWLHQESPEQRANSKLSGCEDEGFLQCQRWSLWWRLGCYARSFDLYERRQCGRGLPTGRRQDLGDERCGEKLEECIASCDGSPPVCISVALTGACKLVLQFSVFNAQCYYWPADRVRSIAQPIGLRSCVAQSLASLTTVGSTNKSGSVFYSPIAWRFATRNRSSSAVEERQQSCEVASICKSTKAVMAGLVTI